MDTIDPKKLAEDIKDWEIQCEALIKNLANVPVQHRSRLANLCDADICEMMSWFTSEEYEKDLGDHFTDEIRSLRDRHIEFLASMRRLLITHLGPGKN